MRRWIRYSMNPEERVMLVSTMHSSLVNCLNCGRWLKGGQFYFLTMNCIKFAHVGIEIFLPL